MSEQIFHHSQVGPYQQAAVIAVRDGGNGLPIHLAMITGDPQSATDNSMTVEQAKLFHERLGKAIETAEKAGL